MAALRSIQEQLHDSVRSYRSLQQEVSQLVTQQVKLQQQVNETKMVEQELAMLDETSEKGENAGVVYKLVGPLLVRQDTYEAKANVAKRLEYIQKEMYVVLRAATIPMAVCVCMCMPEREREREREDDRPRSQLSHAASFRAFHDGRRARSLSYEDTYLTL